MTKKLRNEDLSFIENLIELLKKNDLTNLEISRDEGDDRGISIRLSQQSNIALPIENVNPRIVANVGSSDSNSTPISSEDPTLENGAVTSPMVGTCFLQTEPGSPPFVSIGTTVIEGQTLLIIEAMKTMNHIPAPKAGTIKRILIEDGTPVEFGAPLMIIE
ncbi:MAG: acetyl-CoA carboxylase biotin carboxyl carrier protein subunit [Paracoccaceae bacterium]|nr:acetyl-CoA carboxylase biotin carboxyl carrier protein subunit [Paracoccaceae bacterium]